MQTDIVITTWLTHTLREKKMKKKITYYPSVHRDENKFTNLVKKYYVLNRSMYCIWGGGSQNLGGPPHIVILESFS